MTFVIFYTYPFSIVLYRTVIHRKAYLSFCRVYLLMYHLHLHICFKKISIQKTTVKNSLDTIKNSTLVQYRTFFPANENHTIWMKRDMTDEHPYTPNIYRNIW